MKQRTIWVGALLIVLGIGAVFAGPRIRQWWTAPAAGCCPMCHRHEHKGMKVKIQPEGEAVTDACCVSCALTYGRQRHKAIRFITVSDQNTGKPLDPQSATYVFGSDVSPCMGTTTQLGPEKEARPVQWDRCSPSILAFESPQAAQAFRAEHGGRIRTLAELMLPGATPEAR